MEQKTNSADTKNPKPELIKQCREDLENKIKKLFNEIRGYDPQKKLHELSVEIAGEVAFSLSRFNRPLQKFVAQKRRKILDSLEKRELLKVYDSISDRSTVIKAAKDVLETFQDTIKTVQKNKDNEHFSKLLEEISNTVKNENLSRFLKISLSLVTGKEHTIPKKTQKGSQGNDSEFQNALFNSDFEKIEMDRGYKESIINAFIYRIIRYLRETPKDQQSADDFMQKRIPMLKALEELQAALGEEQVTE